jgi:hypothetical protein
MALLYHFWGLKWTAAILDRACLDRVESQTKFDARVRSDHAQTADVLGGLPEVPFSAKGRATTLPKKFLYHNRIVLNFQERPAMPWK